MSSLDINSDYVILFKIFLSMNLKTLGDFKKEGTTVLIEKRLTLKKRRLPIQEARAVEWL